MLQLGVKGRLSNQEMEQLKHKLASAVAYDHVPEQKIATRRAKPTSQPMTTVYHRVESDHNRKQQSFRPSIKPQAAIAYEQRFAEGSYDNLRMRPPPKGITAAAKTILQDEYVTRPREISVIPRSQFKDEDTPEQPAAMQAKPGKRVAPLVIPQVFIM